MRKTKNIEFMKDQVLSIEQMKHLRELGVDTSKASMYWARTAHGVRMNDESKGKWFLSLQKDFMVCGFISYETVPAFTLWDMFEMMPDQIVYEGNTGILIIYSPNLIAYDPGVHSTSGDNCLDAAYKMLCWLAENKLLGKEE